MRAPRIGAAICIITLAVLSEMLPGRYRLAPEWLPSVAVVIMLGPMIVGRIARRGFWLKLERFTTLPAILLAIAINMLNLGYVIGLLVLNPSNVEPTPLFGTSLMIWVTNTLAFTLFYWEIDAGGPDARANQETRYPDFDFPAANEPEKTPPGWHPTFIDYLFLGFTTSTAFSPTEAMPLTARAKALMIAQSIVSLATISVVAARTINILH